MRIKKEYFLLIILLLLSIVVKFFSPLSYYFISMDEPKYLKLAKNLPHYVLFNKNFYIDHPPFYPVMIKSFSFLLSDHIAGLIVSYLGTIGFIITASVLMKILRIDWKIRILIIILFGLSHLLYYWSNMIYKETFFTFLIYLFLLLFILTIIKSSKIYSILASITGILASFTSDLVIFILPVIVVSIFLYKKVNIQKLKFIFCPIISIFTGYMLWILVRLWVYTHNVYFPAGVDGLIEKVSDWNIFHLFTPRGFLYTRIITQSGISLNPIHYIKYISAFFNLLPPFHISIIKIELKEIVLILCLYMPLVIFFIIGIYSSLKEREKTGYLMLTILFSFIFPIIFEISDPRFSLPCILPVFYFVGKGMAKTISLTQSYMILFALFVLFTIFWIINNPFFFTIREKVIQLEKTGAFLKNLSEDGIMAQFGYPPEIAYLTDKKVICLPIVSEEFETQIEMYDINYIVIGTDETYSKEIVRYIKNNPQKFIKIKEIEEIYPHQKEKVYVFKVKR